MPGPAPDLLRKVAGRYATGVTIVTSVDSEGVPCGLTVNSFTSVSLDPPMVLICIDRTAHSHDCILDSGVFGVNILEASGTDLAERFWKWDRERRFLDLDWRAGELGAPLLGEALGWMECSVVDHYRAGDHTIIIGRVDGCAVTQGEPLIFYGGDFHMGLG